MYIGTFGQMEILPVFYRTLFPSDQLPCFNLKNTLNIKQGKTITYPGPSFITFQKQRIKETKKIKETKNERLDRHTIQTDQGGRQMGQIGGRIDFLTVSTYFRPKKFKSGVKSILPPHLLPVCSLATICFSHSN